MMMKKTHLKNDPNIFILLFKKMINLLVNIELMISVLEVEVGVAEGALSCALVTAGFVGLPVTSKLTVTCLNPFQNGRHSRTTEE